jgi:hypothetical protein
VFILASNAYGSQLDLRARNAISDDDKLVPYDINENINKGMLLIKVK